jgi:hypothetical protein
VPQPVRIGERRQTGAGASEPGDDLGLEAVLGLVAAVSAQLDW